MTPRIFTGSSGSWIPIVSVLNLGVLNLARVNSLLQLKFCTLPKYLQEVPYGRSAKMRKRRKRVHVTYVIVVDKYTTKFKLALSLLSF